MILWSIHPSRTEPSQSAPRTLSPALASGLKAHFFFGSNGAVYSPRLRKTPVIASRSFCRPS